MIAPATKLSRTANLVTGALGFVGRHLVSSLLAAGVPAIGVGKHDDPDDLPRRVGPFRLAGPAAELRGAVRYEGPFGPFWYLPLDLEETAPIADLMAEVQPTMIYHLAAQSSGAASFADPLGTFRTNVQGTLNVLEAVRGLPASLRPVLLSVGSCEEYGPQPPGVDLIGEDAALNPISPYAVSKVTQTLLGLQYARSWDLPVIAVRAFSHTGPGHDPRFAFPDFARQIAAAEAGRGPAEIRTGDLSAVRDFLDVRDVVAAYRLLTAYGQPGRVYNVCSGRPLTMRDGLNILQAGANCPITIVADPERSRPSDTPRLVGDHSALVADTGWAPEYAIEDTLLGLLNEARKEFA